MGFFKKIYLFTLLILSITFIAPMIANAQTVKFVYSVTGGNTYTWIEPLNPDPLNPTVTRFSLPGVAGDPSGAGPGSRLDFYTLEALGGFVSFTPGVVTADFRSSQLFTGTTSDPTFRIGTFLGIEAVSGVAQLATLTISAVPIPEPSTYAILGGSLALLAIAVAKRKKTAQV